MKKTIILSAIIGFGLLLSCSTDDNRSGGGGTITPPVHATLLSAGDATNIVGVYNFTPEGVTNDSRRTSSTNNAGMYYIKGSDEVIINSKEQKSLNLYGPIKGREDGSDLSLKMSSDPILQNPHDVTVSGDFFVVSDGETGTENGNYFIFEKTEEGIVLRNTVQVSFDVWGVQFIGNDLYATVANTNKLAVFKNFLSTHTADGVIIPDKEIAIEGITDIRGIGHDEGVVVLTDIGDENHESDGAFHYIVGFVAKFNNTPADGTMAFQGNQVRVAGHFTRLGNPVAIDYDHSRNVVFVAENKRDGGAVLFFESVEAGGDLPPSLTYRLPGASSVSFQKAH